MVISRPTDAGSEVPRRAGSSAPQSGSSEYLRTGVWVTDFEFRNNLAWTQGSRTIRFSPPPEAAGSDARVGCEPGQVRKEAALSRPGLVPSCPRSLFAAGFLRAVRGNSPPRRGGAEKKETADFADWRRLKHSGRSFLFCFICEICEICGCFSSPCLGVSAVQIPSDFQSSSPALQCPGCGFLLLPIPARRMLDRR